MPQHQHAGQDQPAKLRCLSAAKLAAMQFTPIRWAVDGLIAEGVNLLAGRPKLGKSWLALGAALAVATGGQFLGVPVDQGPVIYLALEDSARRIQARLSRLLAAATWPDALTLAFHCPRTDAGGLEARQAEMRHRRPRLIVVDTFQKIRQRPTGGGNAYAEDYDAVGVLQQLALEIQAAALLICHTRKRGKDDLEPDDPLDEVNGTTGLTAAADAVLVLTRKRHGNEGKLFVSGRDVEEGSLNLVWDPRYCLWSPQEQGGPDANLPEDRRAVLKILRDAPKAVDLRAIQYGLGKTYHATAMLVGRMTKDGLILKEVRGRYRLPAEVNTVQSLMNPFPN